MDQLEVYPYKNGRWNWRKLDDGKTVAEGQKFDSRADAIAAARKVNGSEGLALVNAGGTIVGYTRPQGEMRIVLLRLDGSEVGELDPGPGSGDAQHVTITPAGENSQAVGLGNG